MHYLTFSPPPAGSTSLATTSTSIFWAWTNLRTTFRTSLCLRQWGEHSECPPSRPLSDYPSSQCLSLFLQYLCVSKLISYSYLLLILISLVSLCLQIHILLVLSLCPFYTILIFISLPIFISANSYPVHTFNHSIFLVSLCLQIHTLFILSKCPF